MMTAYSYMTKLVAQIIINCFEVSSVQALEPSCHYLNSVGSSELLSVSLFSGIKKKKDDNIDCLIGHMRECKEALTAVSGTLLSQKMFTIAMRLIIMDVFLGRRRFTGAQCPMKKPLTGRFQLVSS